MCPDSGAKRSVYWSIIVTGNLSLGKSSGQISSFADAPLALAEVMDIPRPRTTRGAHIVIRSALVENSAPRSRKIPATDFLDLYCDHSFQRAVSSRTRMGATTITNMGTWRTELSAACAQNRISSASTYRF